MMTIVGVPQPARPNPAPAPNGPCCHLFDETAECDIGDAGNLHLYRSGDHDVEAERSAGLECVAE